MQATPRPDFPRSPHIIRLSAEVTEDAFDAPPRLEHPVWRNAFPWLIQGTTTAGHGSTPFDLGLFTGGAEPRVVREHWASLRRELRCGPLVHARQVHEATVRPFVGEADHAGPDDAPTSPLVQADCDGHVTDQPGVVVSVATADCIPVFVVDPERRAVAALHAGWRGVVAGVLEVGLSTMRESFGSEVSDLHVHLGPAICGRCYEVGPEVFEAVGLTAPDLPTPIDLREVVADRARTLGVANERLSVSTHCTRCTGSRLFSHRGGDPHRQIGYIGVRE
ncbi:MAG: polyphenol oxidase family protein [Gemmatimonadota bacterium]